MTKVSGWGRAIDASSDVSHVQSVTDLKNILSGTTPRGVTPRGLGRSYGDAAINSGGVVVVVGDSPQGKETLSGIEIDTSRRLARVGAGASIEQMLRVFMPAGFFVPVTPGTRHVTLGGAVASDIHGKNHHTDGTFGHHISSMSVMLSNGEIVEISPTLNTDWFWATVGGMGLTGVVLDATIDLIPITNNMISVTTQRTDHIDELFAVMSDSSTDDSFRYSVAWVDMMSKGDAFGRGVLTRGNHASADSLRDHRVQPSLSYRPRTRVGVPSWFPNGALNTATIKVFNELWFRRAPTSPTETLESVTGFFHPLDGVRHWNRMYGSRGFLQYQCVVPLNASDVLKEIMTMMQKARVPSFLAVLKRMGPANPGPLSFPMEGWTLAVDIAVGSSRLSEVLPEMDEKVIAAGGRHYLSKDAHMSHSTVVRGYPHLDRWKTIRDEMDPNKRWTSDLARRLQLVGVSQ
jgi:decaprenylphospho-beta-D-ribofuranose 2-oxidase